ncbi:aminodeoxychorismate/anthranilate synthase component II, partial [Alphaproteobacteria bacterium]|nr:aminodeoxychorismate/anthranilate synthase component II [Alphaproteobacteria bacterium]
AFAHATRPVYGMQFHPESILTPQGRQLMANFLRLANLKADGKAA